MEGVEKALGTEKPLSQHFWEFQMMVFQPQTVTGLPWVLS